MCAVRELILKLFVHKHKVYSLLPSVESLPTICQNILHLNKNVLHFAKSDAILTILRNVLSAPEQFTILKRCLCPFAFCNYKCCSMSEFLPVCCLFSYFVMNRKEYLQADGELSFHSTLSFSLGVTI